MYMSYCKFEGTYRELTVCLEDVQAHIDECAMYSVSEREIQYFKRIIEEVVEFMYNNDILDDNGNINDDVFNDVLKTMEKEYDYDD